MKTNSIIYGYNLLRCIRQLPFVPSSRNSYPPHKNFSLFAQCPFANNPSTRVVNHIPNFEHYTQGHTVNQRFGDLKKCETLAATVGSTCFHESEEKLYSERVISNVEGKKIVAVGISGGVDSAVSALLLKNKGFEVIGIYMQNWDKNDEIGKGFCTSDEDLEDAKKVCLHLGIPLKIVNFSRRYWLYVFENFITEYELGLTPNPDLYCNKYIKFDVLLDYAQSLGAHYLATGHYAILKQEKNGHDVVLLKGKDKEKDQTYFLASVNQHALRKVLFPIGHLSKPEVRQLAIAENLPNAHKRSSAGICFVGRRNFGNFLNNYVHAPKGFFIDICSMKSMGEHSGLSNYTFGQRAKISGLPEPWFVAGKDFEKNLVFVAPGHDHPALFCQSAVVDSLFWIAGSPPRELLEGRVFKCQFKARYGPNVEDCFICFSYSDSMEAKNLKMGIYAQSDVDFLPSKFCQLPKINKGTRDQDVLHVRFLKPARAITPRQAFVLYNQEICLGGGLIAYSGPNLFEKYQSNDEEKENCQISLTNSNQKNLEENPFTIKTFANGSYFGNYFFLGTGLKKELQKINIFNRFPTHGNKFFSIYVKDDRDYGFENDGSATGHYDDDDDDDGDDDGENDEYDSNYDIDPSDEDESDDVDDKEDESVNGDETKDDVGRVQMKKSSPVEKGYEVNETEEILPYFLSNERDRSSSPAPRSIPNPFPRNPSHHSWNKPSSPPRSYKYSSDNYALSYPKDREQLNPNPLRKCPKNLAPISRLVEKLTRMGFFKRNPKASTKAMREPQATSLRKLTIWPHHDILRFYNKFAINIYEYYSHVQNYSELLTVIHMIKLSCALTFALKYKLRTKRKVFLKFGKDLTCPETGAKFFKPTPRFHQVNTHNSPQFSQNIQNQW